MPGNPQYMTNALKQPSPESAENLWWKKITNTQITRNKLQWILYLLSIQTVESNQQKFILYKSRKRQNSGTGDSHYSLAFDLPLATLANTTSLNYSIRSLVSNSNQDERSTITRVEDEACFPCPALILEQAGTILSSRNRTTSYRIKHGKLPLKNRLQLTRRKHLSLHPKAQRISH